ncbi:hypothetical protein B9Z55_018263 [Caenorhabditis nigoni]|uniref:ATP-dependent DNA helicase n=1 Tax=Caenorhabditis nigoni TaxID=1611254 RepID=A0A2G5TDA0_9PELO|nr:hypothetical protein B9Z55_018263 [Caenorhabditis nigoni]
MWSSPFCLLIHGAAGTGKSAVLRECRRIGEQIYGAGSVAVTAPVASAAVLVDGRTIHSFAQIAPKAVGEFEILTTIKRRCLEKMMGALKVLFIEEIGLLDPVLLAELDHLFKQFFDSSAPFGGISVVGFGDLLQLPPFGGMNVFEDIKSLAAENRDKKAPSSRNLWSLFERYELKKNFRTRDSLHTSTLALLRIGAHRTDSDAMRLLKSLETPRDVTTDHPEEVFAILEDMEKANPGKDFLLMAPTNRQTAILNDYKLGKLGHPTTLEPIVKSPSEVGQKYFYEGEWETLHLVAGCKVMLTRNLNQKKGLVNGSMGILKKINKGSLTIRFDGLGEFTIPRSKYSNEMRTKFWEQYPIRVAEATNIQKSQGLTVDGVVLVTDRIFGVGSVYTALSRAKDLGLCRITRFNVERWYTNWAALRELRRMPDCS